MSESTRPSGVRQEPEGCQTIKKEDVETLCGMGIPKPLAEQALLITGSNSVEAAAAWYFEMQETEEIDLNLESGALARVGQGGTTASVAPTSSFEGEEVKMVFVVNMELKMGIGKTAAQVAHACLGLYRMLIQDGVTYAPLLFQWGTLGEKSVVLSGSDANHLLDLQKRSTLVGLPCYLIRDAGRTQVAPESVTVLSVFGPATKVDQVTGTLSLL